MGEKLYEFADACERRSYPDPMDFLIRFELYPAKVRYARACLEALESKAIIMLLVGSLRMKC